MFIQVAIVRLAEAYEGLGRTEDALALRRELVDLTVAAAKRPSAPAEYKNKTAWLLLTHPIEELQDPMTARALAEEACSREEAADAPNFLALSQYLDTLALAQHRTGDTAAALATQRRALELAPPDLPDDVLNEMQEHLRTFEAALEEAGGAD